MLSSQKLTTVLLNYMTGPWIQNRPMYLLNWLMFFKRCIWNRRWQTFPVKSWVVNVLDFVRCTVSIAMIQPCLCSREAAIDNIKASGHSCVPIKCFNRNRFSVWPMGHSLPSSDLECWLEERNKCILVLNTKNTSPFVLSME